MNQALEALRAGKPIIVFDDESRENEADIVIAAQFITPELITKAVRNSTGIMCVSITEERANQMGLVKMQANGRDPNSTNFSISCDATTCATGVSSMDKYLTIKTLADCKCNQSHIRTPGHMFPLIAKSGLLKERRGHTEASVQLCLLAGLEPVAVIVELMNDDGSMTRRKDICNTVFANDPIITIDQIVEYSNKASFISPIIRPALKVNECKLMIDLNNSEPAVEFKIKLFTNLYTQERICCLIYGEAANDCMIRIHSECFTGNTLGSLHCDCGCQYFESLKRIVQHGSGILFYYLGHEGRSIGLDNKIDAYKLQQDEKHDTISANKHLGLPVDARDYSLAIRILKELRITKFKMLTNNVSKYASFANHFSVEMVNFPSNINQFNQLYLETKKNKMDHKLLLQYSNLDKVITRSKL